MKKFVDDTFSSLITKNYDFIFFLKTKDEFELIHN
jgi:hypothetical protein